MPCLGYGIVKVPSSHKGGIDTWIERPAGASASERRSGFCIIAPALHQRRVRNGDHQHNILRPLADSHETASRPKREPAPLDLDQQLAPALRALAHADLEADQLLPALWRGTNRGMWCMPLQAGRDIHPLAEDVLAMIKMSPRFTPMRSSMGTPSG